MDRAWRGAAVVTEVVLFGHGDQLTRLISTRRSEPPSATRPVRSIRRSEPPSATRPVRSIRRSEPPSATRPVRSIRRSEPPSATRPVRSIRRSEPPSATRPVRSIRRSEPPSATRPVRSIRRSEPPSATRPVRSIRRSEPPSATVFSGWAISAALERDSAVRCCSSAGRAKALAARMDRVRVSRWRFMISVLLSGAGKWVRSQCYAG